MDIRRGVIRLTVIYFAAWLVIGVIYYLDFEQWAQVAQQHGSEAGYWDHYLSRDNSVMSAALLFGLLPFVVLTIAGAIWWVYRGFKPRADRG